MNLKDILFMTRSHTVKPDADLFDVLLAKKLDQGIIRTIKGNPLRFSAKRNQKAQNPSLTLLPIQDLHGYDHAWIGGMGKNLLRNSMTTGTNNQVTFTVNSDGTVALSGTASDIAQRTGAFTLKAGSYIYTSGINESFTTYDTYLYSNGEVIARGNNASTPPNAFTLSEDATVSLSIRVRSGVKTDGIVVKPMVRLSTVSDATFAPYENICPISGRTSSYLKGCGENLCNMADFTGFRAGVEVSGNTLTVATTSPSSYSAAYIGDNTHLVFKAGTYYVKARCTSVDKFIPYYTRFAFRGKTSQVKAYIDLSIGDVSGVMTITEDCFFSILITGSTADENSVSLENIIISKADAAFVPYQQSNDIAYSFGQTVYGGKIDFTAGVLTVDYIGKTFDGTEEISKISTGANAFFRYVSDVDFPNVVNNKYACSHFKNAEVITSTTVLGCYAYYSSGQQQSYIQFRTEDVGSTTATTFKAWLTTQYNNGTPVQVYSKLRTPQTIQLTPQEINLLKGTNNVWSDGDTIELTYKA